MENLRIGKFVRRMTLAAVASILLACSAPMASESSASPPGVQVVSVSVNSGSTKDVQSYLAHVKEFYGDSRKSTDMTLTTEYDLRVRLIEGVVNTRTDLPADPSRGRDARILISNGSVVAVYSVDGTLRDRIETGSELESQSRTLPAIATGSLFQRINVSQVAAQFKSMNYRMEPGRRTSETVVSFPQETLADMFRGRKILSYSVAFDEAIGALTQTMEVEAVSDDETVTTVSTRLYSMEDDVPISTGVVTEVTHTFLSQNELAPNTIQVDPSSLPVVDQDQLDQWEAAGRSVHEVENASLHPESKDYTETSIIYYETVQLNAAPESAFRINGGL